MLYFLNAETLSVYAEGTSKGYVYVPAGSVIVVNDKMPKDQRFVEIEWENRKLKMFAEDLQDRAQLISEDPQAKIALAGKN